MCSRDGRIRLAAEDKCSEGLSCEVTFAANLVGIAHQIDIGTLTHLKPIGAPVHLTTAWTRVQLLAMLRSLPNKTWMTASRASSNTDMCVGTHKTITANDIVTDNQYGPLALRQDLRNSGVQSLVWRRKQKALSTRSCVGIQD